MRVTLRHHRRLSSQRGVVIPIVAIGLVALLGASAFTIDLGHVWQERRNLITSTDAAALATAKDYALGDSGCPATANQYVADNDADATNVGCYLQAGAPGSTAGAVQVEAYSQVDYFFGPAIGLDGTTVYSSTTVSWDAPSWVTGLRPYALCEDVVNALSPPPVAGNGVAYQIFYGKDDQPVGLGLGFFIAKTLLERSGATITFANQLTPKHGAIIKLRWHRADFERTAGLTAT